MKYFVETLLDVASSVSWIDMCLLYGHHMWFFPKLGLQRLSHRMQPHEVLIGGLHLQ